MSCPVEVIKEVGATEDMRYGKCTITVNTATQVNASVTGLNHGVVLRVPGASDPVPNTGIVWVGDENIVAGSVGFPMAPGSSLTLGVDDLDELYVTSNVASQVVYWIGV
jgi:hypothetical protein